MPTFEVLSGRASQNAHVSTCILLLFWPSLPRLPVGIYGLSFVGVGLLTQVCIATGDEGEEYGFDRGSKRSYELEVGDALGTLRSVFVQQVSA